MNLSESSDINAEMLIAIPDRMPSAYLVPPPFPAPLSVLIKRKKSIPMASRRYFQDPRPFTYQRTKANRVPVNSIQDILNQMERESTDYERFSHKKPKRINFYGRYRHRPNRPKVIPIRYGSQDSSPLPPMRDTNPSVANDVNHLITQNPVPQREPAQLYYPNPSTPHSAQSNGLYEQIIATNKHRHETAKDAKPFSLMLDIYPLHDDNKTQLASTIPPPLSPPQLPPLQIDHSYYDSIRFPQIHPTQNYHQAISAVGANDEPEKMVVHLNLYPTKKNIRPSSSLEAEEPMIFFNDREEEVFRPILNPQVYYRSRSSDDKENQANVRHSGAKGDVIDIPRRNASPQSYPRLSAGIPRINRIRPADLWPPINITDYRTTIAPQAINKLLYGEGPPEYTYLGHFNSNEIGRRNDVQYEESTTRPSLDISTKPTAHSASQRNSHQPDNPMVVKNLSLYTRSAITEKPSREPIS